MRPGRARASVLGAALGVLTMFLVDAPMGAISGDELTVGLSFITLALEVAPFLLVA